MASSFPVIYGDEDEGHALRLAGEGRIEFTSDRVILHAATEGDESELSFSYASLLPGPRDGVTVRIGILHPSAGAVPCVLHARSDEDASAIDSAIREARDKHSGQDMRDQAVFAARLRFATPRVFVFGVIFSVNVLVFLLMVASGVGLMSPSGSELLAWGANLGVLTISGEWWRLLTCMFVHIGIIHIGLNMWVLHSVGQLVERIFGNALFAIVYLGSGLIASLVSTYWNGDVIAAGASGAIFGLIGSILGFVLRQKRAIPATTLKRIRSSTLSLVAYNVIFGLSVPGIDNAAHLGGLAAGVVLGYVAARPFEPQVRRAAFIPSFIAALVAALVIGGGALNMVLVSPYARYVAAYELLEREQPSAHESLERIITAYDSGEANGETLAKELEDACLSTWTSILERLKGVGIGKDSPLAKRHEDVTAIAELRVRSLKHLATALVDGSAAERAEFERLHEKANAIVDRLNSE